MCLLKPNKTYANSFIEWNEKNKPFYKLKNKIPANLYEQRC